jgi:hypothetical protein
VADRVELFDVTITAGTAILTPLTTATVFADGQVTDIEVVVPDGCAGLVGFVVLYGGQQIIPAKDGKWIISNGEVIKWPLSGYPTGQQWQIRGYNTDVFDHTLYVRYLIDELRRPQQLTFNPLPLG